MEFFNDVVLEDFVDKTVDLYLTAKPNTAVIESIEMCETFMVDGELHVDPIPKLDKKYAFKVPDTARFSKNEEELSIGRWAIIIQRQSSEGKFLESMIKSKENSQ